MPNKLVLKVCEWCGDDFMGRRHGRFCSKACSKFRPLSERFWPKVHKTEECWLWIGAHGADAYGRIRHDGGTVQATHAAWFLAHGTWPTCEVCHTCDNPSCVRIEHLFLGSHLENMHDAQRKGRIGAGLTLDIAREIRGLAASMSQTTIARRYGVGQSHVSRIIQNKVWREPSP